MKKVRLVLVAVVAMLLLGMSSVSAQESTQKVVIIRISEGGGGKAAMVTIDSEGKTNMIDLARGQGIDISANNGVIIQKELKQWEQKGYKITNLSTTGETLFRTTIILEK